MITADAPWKGNLIFLKVKSPIMPGRGEWGLILIGALQKQDN